MLRAINTQFRKNFNQKKLKTFPKAYQIHSTIATIALNQIYYLNMLFLIETAPPSPFSFYSNQVFLSDRANVLLETLFFQTMLQGKFKKMHSEGYENILQ